MALLSGVGSFRGMLLLSTKASSALTSLAVRVDGFPILVWPFYAALPAQCYS